MELQSNNFRDRGRIPATHTCDGLDRSPHLVWTGAPEETKSFAVSCVDPDAPGRTFVHWLVCNIPPTVTEIPEGSVPAGARVIGNDFGKASYGGPCPPSGTHHYLFTVYALNVASLPSVTKTTFFTAVQDHGLATAQLTGLYSRTRFV